MNCKTVEAKLSAYVDRELNGREMLELREHLHRCSDCQQEETRLRELKAMLGAFRDAEPPAFMEERILAAIGRETARRRTPFWMGRAAQFAALVACVMAVTVGVLRMGGPRTASPAQDISFDVQRDQVWSNSMPGGMTIPTANYGP